MTDQIRLISQHFGMQIRAEVPLLEQIVNKVILMPATGIDAECSFYQYKDLLHKQRESFTPENTKQLTMLYYHGHLEKKFEN